MARISLSHLGFRYPGADRDTLSDLHLTIEDGEAHALLGASGAGKTTLLNILSGLLAPTSGALCFDDRDVSQQTGRARNVAQVFQFPVLYESLSVAENLVFPLRTRRADEALIRERLDYICAELDIADLRALKPARLSLFQKQLVAVGKALIRPDVSMVLLDEPLTAVEPKVKWELRQTLRRVQADLGVTMIYVTHDQTEALTFAERVSVLADGRILQTGTPEQVYAQPEHEFVGHFVGSPGMNFLPAQPLGIADADRIGFRPEWARLLSRSDSRSPDGSLGHDASRGLDRSIVAKVLRVRAQGTQDGGIFALVTLKTERGEVAVRDVLPNDGLVPGDSVQLAINRYLRFQGERRVGGDERL